ncbi:cyclohexanone monooxygenase [Lentinula novae-zelandiae]|nr:cyclohexanone monooxygenase [Lentinula novae-zelandiae]
MSETHDYDVLIVGAGFAGVHQLLNIRKLDLTVKVLETGEDLAGTWLWNRYPGARVDSPSPFYQFSDPELWRDWTYTAKYPDWREIQAYFRYVNDKFDVKRDVIFHSRVASAHWNDLVDRWTVTTEDGRVFRAQFLSLCTGIGSKHHIPKFKGIDTFQGDVYHSARWPEMYDFKDKRAGIIGTGATAIQIIQEIAPHVAHLTVFQRTPNLALPMRQKNISAEAEEKLKKDLYPVFFRRRDQTFSGYDYDIDPKSILDTTREERVLAFEEKWEKGGFHFWVGSYADLFMNQEANDEAYAFWREKVRERIPDPELQEKLAPMQAPHPWGVRRPSLEQRYFEVYSQPNVTLVDVNKTAIEEIVPNGLKTSDGTVHELDILVFATGFDMITGGITSIDIRGQDGLSIKEKWANGVKSHLGLASATYPNMFWIYGPQSPSGLSNGPSSIEMTSEWIINCIKYMKENKILSIVPTEEAQFAYSEHVDQLGAAALWAKAKNSWYMGSNIEGKKVQMLQFPGGLPAYFKLCNDSAAKGYHGFHLKVPA